MNLKDCSEKEIEFFIFGYCYANAENLKLQGCFNSLSVNELANYLMKDNIDNIYNNLRMKNNK